MIEPLEPRRLLSVTLNLKRYLFIEGTDGNDVVVLKVKDETEIQPNGDILHPQHLLVRMNGQQVFDVRMSKVKRIVANLLGGNDSFTGVPTKGTTQDIVGGDGNDTLFGAAGVDSLDGGAGDDSLVGLDGNDVLGSAAGSDTLEGGAGIDQVNFRNRTGAMNITLDDVANDGESGETGNVGQLNEVIICGAGADFVDASFIHPDTLAATLQDETIIGNGGKDTLIGGDGDDLLEGNARNDSLSGGLGNDSIDGGRGRDRLFGEAGDDFLFDSNDNERDTIDGGLGNDTASFDFMDRLRGIEF
jgi:Ca2+-binding RTX toxin-like protein